MLEYGPRGFVGNADSFVGNAVLGFANSASGLAHAKDLVARLNASSTTDVQGARWEWHTWCSAAVAGYGAGLSVSYQANAPSECPSFRHYDNDSKSRQGGTFASVSTRALWGPFIG